MDKFYVLEPFCCISKAYSGCRYTIRRQISSHKEGICLMPKKGENIYKRKDGRWEGRYKKTNSFGKKDYGYVYGKTYREVKANLISTIAQSSIPCEKANSNAPILFETMAFDWIESKKQTIKQSTYCKYTNLLHSYILPAFGKQEIQNMEVNFIENRCNSYLMNGGKEKKGLSSKTVADILLSSSFIGKHSLIMSYLRYHKIVHTSNCRSI